jgi:hypothetical protein
MYLKVGKLLKRRVLVNLLKVIPPEDLEELKSVCLKTVPPKRYRELDRCWGSVLGVHFGTAKGGNSRVQLFLWALAQSAIKEFNYTNSNAFKIFMEKLASTLYHEVGHHVHSKTLEYAQLEEERNRIVKLLRSFAKKNIAREDEAAVTQTRDRLFKIDDTFENFAQTYAETLLRKATELHLLSVKPDDALFFKIQFDRFVHGCMELYEKNRHDREAIGMWSKITGVFDYLRKRKLGKKELYNVTEAFMMIFDVPPEKKLVAKFKTEALKHVKPLFYLSRAQRKFAYFTPAHINKLKKHFAIAGSPKLVYPKIIEEANRK